MNIKDSSKIWELSIKKLYSSLAPDEEREFSKLIENDKSPNTLLELKQLHSKVINGFLVRKIDKEKNWKYINNQISTTAPVRKLFLNLSKYAAVFVVALLIGVIASNLSTFNFSKTSYNKIELEWGQMSKMTLSDGTEVWLNAGSVFEYPSSFNNKERTVVLNGEAHFKVSHHNKIPFEVKTKTGVVKVYGTTFNVASYEDDLEMKVTLVEGKVSVETPMGKHLAILEPSEQISINKEAGKATIRKVNTEFYSSWIEGKILLNETKLSDLTNILKRWYNIDIELADDNIGDIKISGSISKGKPLDLFLKILERMYGVNYKLITNNDKKDKVIIYKKN